MGFRFHRTFRLIPGLRLNLSKCGVSASVRTRGAGLTLGKRGTRATVGIPGTGSKAPVCCSSCWRFAIAAAAVGYLFGVPMR